MDETRLSVVISSEPGTKTAGSHDASSGCCSCNRIVPAGEAMIKYDDGEYLPTFCQGCIRSALEAAEGVHGGF